MPQQVNGRRRIRRRPVPAAAGRQKPKTAKDLKRVFVSIGRNGNATLLGGWGGGRIYLGAAVFKDGKKHRVAVKFFNHYVDGKEAARLQKCINDLRKAGSKIPKTAMVKITHPEKKCLVWVQVSGLFGSAKKGSKIENKSWFKFSNMKNTVAAFRELAKIANAGYCPNSDAIEPRKDGKGVMVLDLEDLIGGKTDRAGRAEAIVDRIALSRPDPVKRSPFAHIDYARVERTERAIIKAVLETASPEMRKTLIEKINGRPGLFIRVEGGRLVAKKGKFQP